MMSEDSIELTIDDVVFGGRGIGRHHGRVVFVPGVLPGEVVRVAVRHTHSDYDDAELLSVVTPSPHRIAPACCFGIQPRGRGPMYPVRCAGCHYHHMPYEVELKLKQQQFSEFLNHARVMRDGAKLLEPQGSPRELHYRNKIMLHASRDKNEVLLGYIQPDSHSVLDIENCPLADERLNDLLAELRAKPGFLKGLRDDMTITLRVTENDGPLFWRGKPDAHDKWLQETLSIGQVSVPRASFFQVNQQAAELMLERTVGYLKEGEAKTIVDLYCGVGVFGHAASQCGYTSIAGIDSDEQAIAAAEYNAGRFGYEGVYVVGDAASAYPKLVRELPEGPMTLVADPPRSGLHPRIIESIGTYLPESIVYVSCSADTLVRDLELICRSGYAIRETGIIDMFPRTPHFETVTWLVRPSGGS